MALKRLIETTLLASLILGTAGCSGARAILRGQSPEDELSLAEVPVPVKRKKEFRLPRVQMTDADQNALLSWCVNSGANILEVDAHSVWFVTKNE